MDPLSLMLIMILFLGVMFFLSSRARKKQQQKQAKMQANLEPGTWVRTIGGMYLRFVDQDGDLMVLETPGGQELYFNKRAVAGPEEPPFAVATETTESAEGPQEADDATAEEVADPEETSSAVQAGEDPKDEDKKQD